MNRAFKLSQTQNLNLYSFHFMRKKDLYCPVQRQSKHATLIAAVVADDTRLETIVIQGGQKIRSSRFFTMYS